MTIVNFYASKLTTRKAWKEQKRDYIKFNMIKQMMVEAYYHKCGHSEMPKCEYTEI